MSQANFEIVRSIHERWADGDFSVSKWADGDIEFRSGDGRTGRGTDVMANLWRDWLKTMDDFAVMPEKFVDLGDDRVLVLARFSGRGKGSGAPVGEFLGGSLFTLNEGKVVRLTLFTDRQQALEAAGLSP
jgi:ketosteroid isomerase-like protein